MRSRLVIAVAVMAAILGFYRLRNRGSSASAPAPAPAAGSAQAASTPTAPVAAPRGHVTKLSLEERQQVAERIAKRQAERAATQAPAAPSLPSSPTPLPSLPPAQTPPPEELKTSIRDAMREAIPFITECYAQHMPERRAIDIKAKLTLSGDPDIGTLVDAHQIFDEQEHPLPKAFDDCLRTTFQQLQLPPLTEGDRIEVTYPFRFEPGE